ncbi:MAG: MFS transporter, partial [Rhodospirillales bacterium]|nr:MFS transporter [Rhodospirillales bacterium]
MIGVVGVAHGLSHFYQLALVTLLLVVRPQFGLSYTDIGVLGAIFYAVSGVGQTAAGFAVDRFGARPVLTFGLLSAASAFGLIALLGRDFWTLVPLVT